MRKNVITSGLSAPLKGETRVPADKSVSHRSLIIGSLTKGKIKISNFLKSADCLATLEILKQLGADISFTDEKTLYLDARNAYTEPKKDLYCGNSGTTMRLLAGLLSSEIFKSTLTGDISLSKRPMKRVTDPLELMGASIQSNDNKAPLEINGKELSGICYKSPIASAQVKSCLLLAGSKNAKGPTSVLEAHLSRDHSERMLKYFDADVQTYSKDGLFGVTINPKPLTPKDINVVGDISSAAFVLAAGAIVPGSEIIIKGVGLNPTRTGIIDVLTRMGADIEILDEDLVSNEEIGDMKIKYSPNLKGIEIKGDIIPRLIDEIPVIALLATQAEGTTIIKDASDLKNKESDRILCVTKELRKLGANIEAIEDGFIIQGKNSSKGLLTGDCELECYHDHRLAMMGYVGGLISKKPVAINDFRWAETSFPDFLNLFERLKQ